MKELTLFIAYISVLTLAISYFSIPLLRKIAKKYDVIDKPNSRKIHKYPTPLLGGIAIWGSFTFVLVLHLIIVIAFRDYIKEKNHISPTLAFYANNTTFIMKEVLTFVICGTLIMLIGLLDDIKKITIARRIILETIVAVIIVFSGFQTELFFLPKTAACIVTIFWIVGIINAINLLDGANGLASGVSIIAAILLSIVMFLGNQPLLGMLLVILVASTLGFFRFNFPKARIFMGSAGSMFLGYVLSVVTILATFMVPEVSSHFALLIPIAILGIPLYDTLSVIAIRLFQRKSVVIADQNHLIHRLLYKGHKIESAVLYIFLFTAFSGGTAIFLLNASTVRCIVILISILTIYGCLFLFEKFVPTRRAPKEYGLHFPNVG